MALALNLQDQKKDVGIGTIAHPPEIRALADAWEGVLEDVIETSDTAGSYNLPIRLI